jgi:retron-type reverse transcriptase
VIDRWLQQAVSQQLASNFELGFEEESFGFRPQKNLQMAVRRALTHIPAGQAGTMGIRI